MRLLFAFVVLLSIHFAAQAQKKERVMLLTNEAIQLEATDALNAMYNFKFDEAETKFMEFQERYPDHPMPYFLMALSNWWKMMPDLENEKFTERYVGDFFKYTEIAIEKGEKAFKEDDENEELAFILAATYGFKGRYYAERHAFVKAAGSGNKALQYLFKFKGRSDLSPEFLFGDALFNYYAEWLKQEYALLRPILAFFPKGDKTLGIKQLKEVAYNAFYTRTEAQYFLMRIYYNEENREDLAYPMAEYLGTTFPNNPYFQRMHARLSFSQGKWLETEKISLDILYKINIGMPGYEAISGRYASFFLGHINKYYYHDKQKAKLYFEKAMVFAEQSEATEMNYYLFAAAELARIANEEKDYSKAKRYYQIIIDNSDNNHELHKEAKAYLSSKKKEEKKKKSWWW
ncbi:MAG TPA: hypothetical protein VK750_09715 [Cytophagaceae bacterium]|jgi:hypothetical protein|nr:hypothetical protein [Cytophagaceae bacterium]